MPNEMPRVNWLYKACIRHHWYSICFGLRDAARTDEVVVFGGVIHGHAFGLGHQVAHDGDVFIHLPDREPNLLEQLALNSFPQMWLLSSLSKHNLR